MDIRYYVILLIIPYFSNGAFNHQVGARVEDSIRAFLAKVAEAASLPITIIDRNVVNISDPFLAAPLVLFPSVYTYTGRLSVWFMGLETGYAMIYYSDIPSFATTYATGINRTILWTEYKYDAKTGKLGDLTGRAEPYDVKNRPWYREAKAANLDLISNKSIWSSPFFSYGIHQPIIGYLTPIHNITIQGHYYPGFAGAISGAARLEEINTYLKDSFQNTDFKIFIIQKKPMYLIGNSWNAPITNGLQYIVASESSDPLISRATNILIQKEWTTDLFIMDQLYVQSQLYVDSTPGVEWYIVVMFPAVVEKDHIGPESPRYNTAIAISAVGIAVSAACLLITLCLRRKKMFKMTQPRFILISLCGCVILGVASWHFTGDNNQTNCTRRPYLFNIGFTMAFTPLLIKSWQVHVVFNKSKQKTKKRKTTRKKVHMLYIFGLILIDILIVTIALYSTGDLTKPVTKLMETNNGAYAELTYCGYHYNSGLLISELVYKSLMILVACYLSFVTRNVVGAVAGSKALFAIVYNTAILSIILITVGTEIKDIENRGLLQILGLTECIVVCSVLLSMPSFYQIMTVGDKAASRMVINNILEGQRPSEDRRRAQGNGNGNGDDDGEYNNDCGDANEVVREKRMPVRSSVVQRRTVTILGSLFSNETPLDISAGGLMRSMHVVQEVEEEDDDEEDEDDNDNDERGEEGRVESL